MKRLLFGLGIGTALAYGWKRFLGEGPTPSSRPWEETDNDPEDRLRAGHPEDATLVDRVKSEIFRESEVASGQVNVNAEYGRVILRGEVESEDMIRELVERTRQVDGVRDVENKLHTPGQEVPA